MGLSVKPIKLLRTLPEKLGTDAGVPYTVTFPVDKSFQLPADFPFADYPGLNLLHTVNGDDHILISYWRSRDYYEANGGKIRNALNLSCAEHAGLVSDVKAPKKRFWAKWSAKDIIVGAAGVVSAFAVLNVFFANAFAPPDLQVAFAEVQPVDVTPGMPVTVTSTVLNGSLAESRILEISGEAKRPGEKTALRLNPDLSSYPSLAAGQSVTFKLSCIAPPRKTVIGPPEILDMTMRVSAKAGHLQGKASFSSASARQMQIWSPRLGWGKPSLNGDNQSPKFKHLTATIYLGKSYPQGVNGTVDVTSLPNEIDTLHVRDQTGDVYQSPVTSTVTRTVDFHTPALERFVKYAISIDILATKELAPSRWNEIVSKVGFIAN
jgi:hypothetical protein